MIESFLIKSALGSATLEFSERFPADRSNACESYCVHLNSLNLDAILRVETGYPYYFGPAPTVLFAQMAALWKGWSGALEWSGADGRLSFHCSQDRAGHVLICVKLTHEVYGDDWKVQAKIHAEAGQLDGLARSASAFFGVV